MSNIADTEITLGTAKVLGLFFALVVVCAVFFAMGFSMGRNSVPPALASGESLSGTTASTPATRPSAVKAASSAGSDQLTFYKTVGQNSSDAQLQPAATTSNNAPATNDNSAAPAEHKATAPDPMVPPALTAAGYYVQVAAVTKQEDAEALVDALKKKQYPAFSVNNPSADKLFHVQVGPFGDIKDAEATRSKLVSDGYNPIVKK